VRTAGLRPAAYAEGTIVVLGEVPISMAEEQQLLDLIESNNQGVLAAVTRAGYPHLTNVLYIWDAEERVARVSTTADRVKGKIVQRDPHAALHVSGPHFWSYAVAECDAEPSAVATTPGDDACRELLTVHSAFYGELEEDAFFQEMIDAKRLVIRLRVRRLYGVILENPPG
jgi:PPOX class probable F420-dependent enzyme